MEKQLSLFRRDLILGKWLSIFLAAGLLLASVLSPAAAAGRSGEPEKGVSIQWGVKIPVRDGVKLNGTLYKPKEAQGPLPVIFTFTPYIADTYHERGMYFAANGYIFLGIDVRGRGNSEGDFEPFVN